MKFEIKGIKQRPRRSFNSLGAFALGVSVMFLLGAGGPGPLSQAIAQMWGGPVDLRSAATGQAPVKQADGSWAPGTVSSGSVSTSGDALSGDGTSGNPLAAAADLENLVDNWAIDASGNGTAIASIAVTTSITASQVVRADRYVGDVSVAADVSISFADGAIQTITVSTDAALTTDLTYLGAGQAMTLEITSTSGGSFTYPANWKWLGTAPTTISAGGTLVVQLYCVGNNETDVRACATELGTGS